MHAPLVQTPIKWALSLFVMAHREAALHIARQLKDTAMASRRERTESRCRVH